MADKTKIEWTDATVNFWWGCTKVGPGCDHCYAETWSKRTGGNHWGVGVPRRKIVSAVKTLERLNRDHPGHRVFVQSMSDLFDKEVPVQWFADAWNEIDAATNLEIQIVTKRVSFIEKRLNEIGEYRWPKHAGLIISVVNQDEANRDIPRLLDLKGRLGIPWVGLSMEPLLGGVDLEHIELAEPIDDYVALNALTGSGFRYENEDGDLAGDPCEFEHIDWVIVGGESGVGARPINRRWVRDIRDQCSGEGIHFLFKQWGEWFPFGEYDAEGCHNTVSKGQKPGYWHEWGAGDGFSVRLGKKAAGRRLDNALHDGFPTVEQRNIGA